MGVQTRLRGISASSIFRVACLSLGLAYVLWHGAVLPLLRWQLQTQFSVLTEEEAAAKNMAIRGGCQHRARLGGKGGREGSWEVCLDDATLLKRMREGTCVVYSFGVRDDWSFDATIAQLGCTV